MKSSTETDINQLPPIAKVRPMVMLTGFLGAGKTTLLRKILDNLAEREILSDVILNDRENAYIDKATLKDHAADVAALTGTCVCCEGFHDLINLIMNSVKSKHDVLLIELNGTADPVPLQESFTLLESKVCMRPRWQVCVVDARYFRKRRLFNDLESLQLETASHYYISWSSELTQQEEEELESKIKAINKKATRTTAELLADGLSHAIQNNLRHTCLNKQSSDAQNSSSELANVESMRGESHDRHQLAHEFTGCQIIIPEPVDESYVRGWLEKLPDSVIRAKALLMLDVNDERRYLFERVGTIVSPEPFGTRAKKEEPNSCIFIGADLDPEELLHLTKEYLHAESYLLES